jgi:hypothetical protein
MPANPIIKLRKIALALPEAHEVEAWGTPTFRVKNKLFAMYAKAETHVGRDRDGVWCKAAPGQQNMMVDAEPQKFFVPPYVGPSGWVGIWLDGTAVDWPEVAELLRDSFAMIAPKKLLPLLTSMPFPRSAR